MNPTVELLSHISVAVNNYRKNLSDSIKSMIPLAYSIMDHLDITSIDGHKDWQNLREHVIKPKFEPLYHNALTRAVRLSEFSGKLLKVIKYFQANKITPTQMAEDDLVNVIEDVFATNGNFIDRYHLSITIITDSSLELHQTFHLFC